MLSRSAGGAAAVLLCGLFAADAVHATESYDNCAGFIETLPATITQQGNWCLRKDLATSIASGSAIIVAANNVSIDCHGFKLGGLAAGAGTMAAGIHSTGRANVVVRDCKIRGFRYGVLLQGNGGHLVEDNRLDGNTYVGIDVDADNVTVRRNQVFDTGGASDGSLTAVGILLDGLGCTATDNTVSGVEVLPVGEDSDGSAYGLDVRCDGAEIRENRVGGLMAPGWSTGIRTDGAGTRIVDNFVHGSADTLYGVGVSGEGPLTVCQRNVVTGTVSGFEYCEDDGNVFLGNPI